MEWAEAPRLETSVSTPAAASCQRAGLCGGVRGAAGRPRHGAV